LPQIKQQRPVHHNSIGYILLLGYDLHHFSPALSRSFFIFGIAYGFSELDRTTICLIMNYKTGMIF